MCELIHMTSASPLSHLLIVVYSCWVSWSSANEKKTLKISMSYTIELFLIFRKKSFLIFILFQIK